MPITITTHHEVFLVEHDTIPGMLRETADLVEELEGREQGNTVEIELEVGLIGCRMRHGIRVFYRAENEDAIAVEVDAASSTPPGDAVADGPEQVYPSLVPTPADLPST